MTTEDTLAQPEQPVALTAPALPDATTAPVLPAEVQSAIDTLERARAEVERINSLLDQATRDRADAERASQESFGQLAEAEAAALLDGSTPNDTLRKKAEQHQRSLLVHNARIQGLQGRRRTAATALEEAMALVNRAVDAWIDADVQKACEQFNAELQRFVAAIEAPLATGIALNNSRLISIAQRSQIADESRDRGNAFEIVRYWKQNPRMLQVTQQYNDARRAAALALDGARKLVIEITGY